MCSGEGWRDPQGGILVLIPAADRRRHTHKLTGIPVHTCTHTCKCTQGAGLGCWCHRKFEDGLGCWGARDWSMVGIQPKQNQPELPSSTLFGCGREIMATWEPEVELL